MRKACFLLAVVFLALLASAQKADIILHHGKIFTADRAQLYVEAVAIKGATILSVGKNEEILRLKGRKTTLIDLQGKTVIPGINDAHTHPGPEYAAAYFTTMQVPGDPTPWLPIRDSIILYTKNFPKGTMIRTSVGGELFDDENVRRKQLDNIAPEHPVILSAWTGHGVILNSKALELIGYDESKTFLGGIVEKDANGKLNGVLHEYAEFPINKLLTAKMDPAVIRKDIADYYQHALTLGITSDQAMATQMGASFFNALYRVNDYKVRARVIAFPFTDENSFLVDEWKGYFTKTSNLNSYAGIKIILDGTPIERFAAMRTAYSDRPGYFGRINFDFATIKKYVQTCNDLNQQIIVHASGDSAIKTFIRVLKDVAPAYFWKTKRVRIEHADMAIVHPADLEEIKELGIIIVPNPTHFALPQLMAQRYGNRAPMFQAFRSLIDNGIPVAIGSDGPNNPYLNIMLSVIHPDNPKEAVSIEEAVIAYTYGSAYAEFKEKEKGTLVKGKFADITVLSQDIFTIPLPQLPGTQSLLTMIGGKIVYDAKSN